MSLVTIMAREMGLKIFRSRRGFGDVASAASHVLGARVQLKFFKSRSSFGDGASVACDDVGAKRD